MRPLWSGPTSCSPLHPPRPSTSRSGRSRSHGHEACSAEGGERSGERAREREKGMEIIVALRIKSLMWIRMGIWTRIGKEEVVLTIVASHSMPPLHLTPAISSPRLPPQPALRSSPSPTHRSERASPSAAFAASLDSADVRRALRPAAPPPFVHM